MNKQAVIVGNEILTVPEPFWWHYPLNEITPGLRRIVFEETE